MTKKTPLTALAVFSAALLLAGTARPSAGQTAEVNLQTVEPFAYFCLPVKGTYAQIQEVIGKLMLEMQAQNAMPTGALIGVFYNSPEDVESAGLEWEVGFPAAPRQAIQPPLVLKEWRHAEVAVAMHKGPYGEVGKTITKIMDWMAANGYAPSGPMLERYLDMNPAEMNPQDLRTEVWFPCRKK